jgi:hypothetical protein
MYLPAEQLACPADGIDMPAQFELRALADELWICQFPSPRPCSMNCLPLHSSYHQLCDPHQRAGHFLGSRRYLIATGTAWTCTPWFRERNQHSLVGQHYLSGMLSN